MSEGFESFKFIHDILIIKLIKHDAVFFEVTLNKECSFLVDFGISKMIYQNREKPTSESGEYSSFDVFRIRTFDLIEIGSQESNKVSGSRCRALDCSASFEVALVFIST